MGIFHDLEDGVWVELRERSAVIGTEKEEWSPDIVDVSYPALEKMRCAIDFALKNRRDRVDHKTVESDTLSVLRKLRERVILNLVPEQLIQECPYCKESAYESSNDGINMSVAILDEAIRNEGGN